jgi:cytoskeletal protein CcmA (bactofilin family)
MASNISIIAAGTFIRGNLYSDDVLIVEGGIEGKIIGNQIIIKARGWVQGEMACRSLLIESGGMLNGFIRVSNEPVQAFLAWSENQPALSELDLDSSSDLELPEE